jgi:hypothetical protein
MRDSGVPWRYRNIFLEGGVNTGQGWETKGGGPQWALTYMQESDSVGAIPVFSYYEICQSNGPGLESLCNYDPQNVTQLIFNNLNNVATMTAYYTNFKLLLAQASLFGKPVILHIEVDTWGLMELRAPGVGGRSRPPCPARRRPSWPASLTLCRASPGRCCTCATFTLPTRSWRPIRPTSPGRMEQ